MDVRDILTLNQWIEIWTPQILDNYRPLRDVLANNAQQASAQPVTAPLDTLVEFLYNVPISELSTLQMNILGHIGIEHLLGRNGVYWIKKTVKSAIYDPATVYEEVQRAVNRIEQAQSELKTFVDSAIPLGFDLETSDLPEDKYRIAVMFQKDASIENVPDLTKSSKDWEQIISGVAGAVDERPEETDIIGVSNGSIIVFLTATAAVTKLLAIIAKHASEIASYSIGVADQLEDLRAKKMHNATVEKELRTMEKTRRKAISQEALKEVTEHLPNKIKPEQKAVLENAIKKYLSFREKGGDVDFSPPRSVVFDDEDFDEEAAAIVNEVSELIENAQTAKQNALLLEKKRFDQQEDED
ncbi:hypothetical protein F9L33_03505 [Amylibacter sp. SFDW26]|uniref:hypothetical protein n=1 Tax=Amylibacter sp. SFDW26 TaxID=2652722 RepID=UPI001261E835|nr:hypothetical protein [Amylibacter sp. SFDW26]KAB7615838.1 hypothetical protein F9L33_03505 [Amylibacter sp. SFDW26]